MAIIDSKARRQILAVWIQIHNIMLNSGKDEKP